MSFYTSITRNLLFSLDPETSHELMLRTAALAKNSFIRSVIENAYHFEDPRLSTELFGLHFKNPIGLAAGIDKNARAIELLSALGPGSLEIGVVSAKPQPGNERPRIFRFPEQRALINRMGNPNIGADAARENLKATRERCKSLPPIGLNVGKTTVTPIEEAAADYAYTMSKLGDLIDYYIINVSCPNVAGYSKMQERESLIVLLKDLVAANTHKKPILVKCSPDLDDALLDDVLECCLEANVAGVMAVNTTLTRTSLPASAPTTGGMSGKPLYPLAISRIKYIANRLNGRIPLIGLGGVSSASDVIEMLRSGAAMVELYTALVYEGPSLLKRIKKDLVAAMERDGVKSISEYCRSMTELRMSM